MVKSLLAVLALSCVAQGKVVINEVMYHAPNDIDDLEYIELHNTAAEAVDLAGWGFSKGIKFKFPAGARIGGNGFVVIARHADRFREAYQFAPAATFDSKISNGGENLVLVDAGGVEVDAVKFDDKAPWPVGADGHSGSLERIDPNSDGGNPANWVSSPLAEDHRRPMGTPGKVNAGFAKKVPPVISNVKFTPEDPGPGQTVQVQAEVKGAEDVQILYRVAGPGFEKEEITAPMRKGSENLFVAKLPAQGKDQLVRFRIKATEGESVRFFPAVTEPRPALSYYVHEPIQPAKVPFAWIIETAGPGRSQDQNQNQAAVRYRRPNPFEMGGNRPRGPWKSALIYFDPATKKTQVFDFVQVHERKAGRKVRLYGDQPLNAMTTLNLIFEYDERFLFTEPMAYEIYRQSGMAAQQSYHVRMWLNGKPMGYQLLVEQPNKAFLRRSKIGDEGNMYKLLWYEQGVVGQHEKKTNKRGGHQDVQEIVNQLNSTRDREQWDVIKKNFDVEQVATYFAVNSVLSHWDGYFNNYFAYHDVGGSGKWMMFPWDQDKTWGITDGRSRVFYNMPLTFGMNGDKPPGSFFSPSPGQMNFGEWWRPPGWFSGPLLANSYFRKIFLSKTRDIVENVYTEEKVFPLIDEMGKKMREEVEYRAKLGGESAGQAAQRLESHLNWLKEHLKKRREYLLAQKELQEAGRAR